MDYSNKKGVTQIAKGVGCSIIAILLATLVFAIAIKIFSISSAVITPVNQIIKALAIFFGCLVAVRESKGWLKGLFIGVMVIVVTYFIFAIVAGNISFGFANLLEILFGGVVGAISGVVAVNLRSSNS